MVVGNGAAIIFAGYLVPALNGRLGALAWRSGWLVLGLITLAVAAVAAALLRNDPADLGVEPVGRKEAIGPERLVVPPGCRPARILGQLGLLYLIFGATYIV